MFPIQFKNLANYGRFHDYFIYVTLRLLSRKRSYEAFRGISAKHSIQAFVDP